MLLLLLPGLLPSSWFWWLEPWVLQRERMGVLQPERVGVLQPERVGKLQPSSLLLLLLPGSEEFILMLRVLMLRVLILRVLMEM